MIETVISVLIVSGIAGLLAAVLVLAERFITNYGECEIDINGERSLTVKGGDTLLEALSSNDIFIPSACGGRSTCGYCKLKVLEGGGVVLPTEAPFVSASELEEGMRLSCQVKIRNDLRIEIPPELFLVRQFQCVCSRITDLSHDIKEFHLEVQDLPEIAFTPGQYVQLFSPSYDGNEEVYRAYSISVDPAEKNIIELVIRLVPGGICSSWAFDGLKEGDPVQINGPYGEFSMTDSQAPMIFIAGGSGMAPIKCMLHQMRNDGISRPATYRNMYSVRNAVKP